MASGPVYGRARRRRLVRARTTGALAAVAVVSLVVVTAHASLSSERHVGMVLGSPVPWPSFGQELRLGVELVLTGYERLLLLVGLLVTCRRLRSIFAFITSFTVAHSVTSALAALNVFTLSARVVDPLVSATIVFVGVENLLRGDEPRGRVILTFVFGLIHGFVCGSALRELGVGVAGMPALGPLLGFDLGVGLGQVAVAGVLLPGFWVALRSPLIARHGPPLVSMFVAAAGAYLLLQRLAF